MAVELNKRKGSQERDACAGLSLHAGQKGIIVKKNHLKSTMIKAYKKNFLPSTVSLIFTNIIALIFSVS